MMIENWSFKLSILSIFLGSVRIEIKPVMPGEGTGAAAAGEQQQPDPNSDEDWLDEALEFKDGNWPQASKR